MFCVEKGTLAQKPEIHYILYAYKYIGIICMHVNTYYIYTDFFISRSMHI